MITTSRGAIPLVGLEAVDHPSGADLGTDRPPRAVAVKAERSEQRLSAEGGALTGARAVADFLLKVGKRTGRCAEEIQKERA